MALLAVPNVSEGRDAAALDAIGAAFERGGSRVLDRHADPDHHRAVYSLAARRGALAEAVACGVEEALRRLDVTAHAGVHPRVGAVDVAPIVFTDPGDRGAALAEAVVLAELLGAGLELPVYLYGLLAGGRTRADLRRHGSAAALVAAIAPDHGPRLAHPTGGAILVAARPPLVAFNVEVAVGLDRARDIAARIRAELPGVRALGFELPLQGVVQVSTNIEDTRAVTAAQVVAAVARDAPVLGAELVGLAPEHTFADWSGQVPIRGLDRDRKLLERVLG